MLKKPLVSLLFVCIAAIAIACAPIPEAAETTDAMDSTDAVGTETIALAENPWPASELNVAVAKIIIEQELGNPVEIVALDENAQWDALAAGDLDASLEVWPSGHGERIASYIEELGTVEHGGTLGPIGEIGWYVPKYAIDANPRFSYVGRLQRRRG